MPINMFLWRGSIRKMRCYSCNNWLNDFESTRKSAETGDYLDICNKCSKGLELSTIDRKDLPGREYLPDYDESLDTILEPFRGVKELKDDPFFEDEVQDEE